jgi:adenine-specific DNA-methyltransferase
LRILGIFTTTQYITVEMLDRIQDEMQPDENLLICCKIFAPECEGRHATISVKKIPAVLLGKCEFGKDDYSFKIVNLPKEEGEEFLDPMEEIPAKVSTTKAKPSSQPSLFD